MEKIKTRPWDSAEHLKTEEDIAEYFEACLLEGGDDPTFIAQALGVIARARYDTSCPQCGPNTGGSV
jgi:probable addiction module antidote protein